jgi:hypothetical protein
MHRVRLNGSGVQSSTNTTRHDTMASYDSEPEHEPEPVPLLVGELKRAEEDRVAEMKIVCFDDTDDGIRGLNKLIKEAQDEETNDPVSMERTVSVCFESKYDASYVNEIFRSHGYACGAVADDTDDGGCLCGGSGGYSISVSWMP